MYRSTSLDFLYLVTSRFCQAKQQPSVTQRSSTDAMAVADAMPSGELEVQKVQKHKDCQDNFIQTKH